MSDEWQVVEGTGWIELEEFGRINPRQDNFGGGRQYFTAQLENGEYARAAGPSISGGPETFNFVFDERFWLADRDDRALEVEISPLVGGRYAVKYRPSDWPQAESGGAW